MANATLYPAIDQVSGFSLFSLNFDDARIVSTSTTTLVLSASGFTASYFGTFIFGAFGLSGGTVTGFNLSYGDQLLVSLTNMNLDVEQLAYSSPSQAENLIFGGDDVITSTWNGGDTYNTLGGNDRIQLGTGNDIVDGGTGIDTFVFGVNFGTAKFDLSGLSVRFSSAAGTDTLRNIEILEFLDATFALSVGSSFSNTLTGDQNVTTLRDIIFGGAGSDTISGKAGNDQLFGNGDNDILNGGQGADRINGGAGADKLVGSAGFDILQGGRGNDIIGGGAGDDRLFGQKGGDKLTGHGGDDTLLGLSGKDVLIGHKGNDILTGGTERDRFVFSKGHGSDTITDFEIGLDKIEIGRGASRLEQLTFAKQGTDVLLSFANVEVLVNDVTVKQLNDGDNFIF